MTAQVTGAGSNNTGGERQPEMSASKSKTGAILSYFLLPGIIPEIKELTRGKFGYLAYLIAMIYQIVRILPENHPYTKSDNIGRFGIRQVIAAAANQIQLDRKHIDQIIVFIAVLAGLLLIVLQFISFIFFLFMGSAWAQVPAEADSLFITANPQTDIAFYMIREVFGLPDMFGTLDNQTGLHLALHKLFEFYNLALLFVGVLIFLYYVIVVVAETAQTGSPFGQRFSKVYAPFRLVIAIGLLVPLNYGFNGAQYIAFYAAQLGSSFATNGWVRFNQALADSNPLGAENATLIAQPNVPDLTGLIEALSVIVTCREAYGISEENGGEAITIEPYFIDDAGNAIQADNYQTFLNIQSAAAGHISVYFGELPPENNPPETGYPGNATPYCGEVKMPTQIGDQDQLNLTGDSSPTQITDIYFVTMIASMWYDARLEALGQRIAYAHNESLNPCTDTGGDLPGVCELSYKPPSEFKREFIDDVELVVHQEVNDLFARIREDVDYTISDEVLLTGWGGAGIWYNKIAQVNGAFVTALQNIPNIENRPIVMEEVLDAKIKSDAGFVDCKSYEANIANNKEMEFTNAEEDGYYSSVLNETYQYWRCDRNANTSNFFWDSINAIFGLTGLFNIRATIDTVGANGSEISTTIHPLAKLSTIGKGLVESAVQNMGLAMSASFGGGMLGVLSPQMGSGLGAASSMFVSIATVGLSIGFVLYYILPFLPFMYFFFAVGGWVKGLFEAMVGTPLWALAHLRIDGEGLPGKSAMNGYLLIFEIFLRPILTVFGLIGGMAIFTAMATILNDLFDIVVTNITGADINEMSENTKQEFNRHLIDQFFFTIVYAIILYMMAMASFKMITLVPNNILRWLGQSVSAFNDQAGDPAAGVTQYAAIGGRTIGGQLATGATQASHAAGSAAGEGLFGLSGTAPGRTASS